MGDCTKKGCFEGDCSNGFGTYKYSNGGTDKGIWINGKMNGYGLQIQGKGEFEGDIYEGYFVNGEYNGNGTYYFSKYDAKLIGEFKSGKPNGYCTVFFGSNSTWTGTFTGNWINGYNIEFEEYVKTTKNGEQYIFSAVDFFDTINYYYNYANIQRIIDEISKINHRDLTKEKISPNEISALVASIRITQYDMTYSLEMIKSFKEYDTTISYKKAMIEYLDCFKSGFENEFSNWILIIQHKPDKNKQMMIIQTLQPFVDRVKSQTEIWKKVRDNFKDKYNIEIKTTANR